VDAAPAQKKGMNNVSAAEQGLSIQALFNSKIPGHCRLCDPSGLETEHFQNCLLMV
jgi:hypothetical protein